jgi:hypothetical protein
MHRYFARPAALPFAAALLLAGTATADDAHRQLGAHVHGHGTLNIAIEGNKLTVELEAPGADIVGFEHAAHTKKQKAAIAEAKKKLSAPLALFVSPPAAGCKTVSAKVELEAGDHHDAKHAPAKNDGKGEAEHSAFHADYVLECSNIAALTQLEARYFKLFDKADELDVGIVGPKGQTKAEISKTKPILDLRGAL